MYRRGSAKRDVIGHNAYRPGDRVVYMTHKHSAHPGPRAESLQPERHGEGYFYAVRKYWRVLDVRPDGTVAVVTRRGKYRVLPISDPCLRPARWWENVFLASRFPEPPDANSGESTLENGANMSMGA